MAAKKDDKVEAKDERTLVVDKPVVEEKPAEVPMKVEGANTVLVQAVRSFEGIEGDKGPASEPFRVSRQRYADLKANDLVKLVDDKAGSDSQ